MIVLITSLTPRLLLSSAAQLAHRLPASIAAPHTTGTPRAGDSGAVYLPAQAVARAPSSSWPSAPMFHTPACRASVTARPVYSSGQAFTTVSVSRYWSPAAPASRAEKTLSALAPMHQSPRVRTANAEVRARRAGTRAATRAATRVPMLRSSCGRAVRGRPLAPPGLGVAPGRERRHAG